MTWVKTKLELERMAPGEELAVRCREGEALENVPRSAREAGHDGQRRGHDDPDRARVSSSRRSFLRELAGSVRDVTAAAQPASLHESAPAPRARWRRRASSATRASSCCRSGARPPSGRCGAASVLVVGAGALGSPVALYLAGAGVGRLGIVDGDEVELSNLHRQLLHFTPDVGVPKAHSAAAKLGFLNPEVVVEPYQVRLDASNAAGLIEGADLVVDCSDSFDTRYAVNAACCAARIPLVRGRRARHERPRDGHPPGGVRVLPLRLPRAAAGRAELRDRGRARPGRRA